MAAAVLAIFTGLFAVLIAQDGTVHQSVVVAAAIAGVCLAIVTPFDASQPPERKRVVFACALYSAMIAVASICALTLGSEVAPLGGLIALAAAGIALLIWAFKTRNRVRRSMWANYYDR